MKRILGWICSFLLVSFCAIAQAPHLRHYSVDDGLPSSFIYKVFQDSKGYIWVGTDRGVARFDGYSFEHFTTNNGLPYNDVFEFVEDDKGRIWLNNFMTHFAYFDYADGTFHVIKNNSNLHMQVGFNRLISWHDKLWVTQNSLVCTDGRQYITMPQDIHWWGKQNATFNKLYYTNMGSKDVIDFESKKVVFKLPIQNIKHVDDALFCDNQFLSLTLDTICLSNQYQTICKDIRALSKFPNSRIYFCKIVSEGAAPKIFIATDKEYLILDHQLRRLHEYDFINGYNVNNVLEDKEGNIWIATKNDGLYITSPEAMQTSTFARNVLGKKYQIRALAADKQQRIWAGTDDGTILYLEDNKLQPVLLEKGSNEHIRSLAIDNDNRLYANTNSKLFSLNINALIPQAKTPVHLGKILRHADSTKQKINYLGLSFKDEHIDFGYDGTKKVSLLNDGIIAISATGEVVFLEKKANKQCQVKSIPTTRNYALAKDEEDNIWLATHRGLKIIKQGNMLNLDSLESGATLLSRNINDIARDNKNNIWAGTDGFGLYYMTPEQQQKIIQKKRNAPPYYFSVPLLDGIIIKSIFIDACDNVWLSTNQGAYKVQPKEDGQFYIKRYSLAQGLPTNEVFSIYANETHAYFGTNEGIVKIDINADASLPYSQDPLYLTAFVVNGKTVKADSSYQLPHNENNLVFKYVCLSFRSHRDVMYHYRMVKNSDWSTAWQTSPDLKKEYPLMGAGNYVFQVKATNVDGKQSDIASLHFSIALPWWEQTWFYILIATLLCGAVGAFMYFRLRIERNKERERNQFAAMRLQALQSQMNPHFTNNALLAIQYFISNADNLSAREYLAKFADLSRKYLEASRQKFVPLSDEIALLTNYLELEHLRFGAKFDYSIVADELMVADTPIFPAMLLQPLAENAINHGLVYAKQKGNLLVEIKKNGNIIHAIVEDNGIGRKAAIQIKAKMQKTHISRAGQIMQDMQQTINSLGNMNIHLETIDKEDEQGNSLGTKVIVTIAYLKNHKIQTEHYDYGSYY